MSPSVRPRTVEYEKLTEQSNHMEQEARMILPGVQALFGFQLVAAFEPVFWTHLSFLERLLHWGALALIAIAALLFLLPAAYHRQVEPDRVSDEFIKVTNRSLYFGLYPMTLAIVIDFYLIGRAITNTPWISGVSSAILFSLFSWGWFVFPKTRRRIERRASKRPSSSPVSLR